MKIESGGYKFDFTDALDAFVFDETDKDKSNYHGLSHAMKAVDIIVELDEKYLFIEIKDFNDPNIYADNEPFNYLRETLKYKYRDTWLYRWAEGKINKPIVYICLLELESGLVTRMNKEMQKQLPLRACGPKSRWCNEISSGCAVLSLHLWNTRFTAWPVSRLAQP